MPLRPAVSSTVTRTLVALTAVAGLGVAFAVGTSYGGSDQHRTGDPRGTGTDVSPAAYSGSDLTLAQSCEDLLAWYVERGMELVGPYGWGGNPDIVYEFSDGGVMQQESGAASDQSVRAPSAAQPAPVRATNGETGTNVQETGVDEPDVVKTDGHTLFRVQDGDLVTYDVSGTEVERLASLDLPGAAGADSTEILLSGDTVVALSQRGATGSEGRAGTELATVDVSDPAVPEITHTVEYNSALVTARLHDGVVRLVLQAALPDLDFTQPDDHTTEFEATEANRDAVRDSTVEDWLPGASLDDGAMQPLLGCDQVAIPDDGTSLGTMAVVGFDAVAPDSPSVSGLAVDTDLAYASADQLYLATSPTFGGMGDCFDCMELAPQSRGSQSSGLLPGWLTGGGDDGVDCCTPIPAPRGDHDDASHLYAFDLDGIDTTFAASGQVDGVIRDRWSMDAVGSGGDGVLRVAVGPNGSTGNFNSIVTFRQEGNDLVEAGRLDDLGVDEDIKSVRWFDTLAIVVTFREVDPLYAVDLTDGDDPVLMGELKIPGYSAYLHPLGEHRLLGLGEGPGEDGAWGAQAGLFNVTDLTNPQQVDVLSFGPGSQALATQDPRQLTWLPDGRTVLTVVAEYGKSGNVGSVSVLTLGEGQLSNRMVPVEYGDEVTDVRLVPLADGRVVLVTGDDAASSTSEPTANQLATWRVFRDERRDDRSAQTHAAVGRARRSGGLETTTAHT